MIAEIREEKFPLSKDIVLSNSYCLTRGDLGEKINLCRFRGYVTDEKNKNIEVLIFSSPCLLRMLSYPKWFIDGTFKIVPRSYRQLLIIIIYHTQLKCYLPACFILMSHKSKAAYEYAFRNLFLICRNLDIKLNPEFIMCDFEAALRKGIIEIFPKAQIVGCYFHYCKALWSYMSHNSLTTKERLNDSIKLMVFLKILAHIEISERKSLFQGIKDLFEKKDKGYKEMLAYYQKNWLNSYFVEPMDIGEGEEDALLIVRTTIFANSIIII